MTADTIDMDALRTMKLVVELGSFSAAAARLDVKQSTVSYRIDRLRRTLRDPLFVREGGGVRPTERCLDAAALAERLFEATDALLEGGRFDPSTAIGEVTIACNVYERAFLLPGLVRRLRADAPGLRLIVAPSLSSGAQKLRDGGCDILLSPKLAEHDAFDAAPLFRDRYVVAMDAGNGLAAGQMAAKDYEAAAHVMVDYGGGWRSPYLDAAAAVGVTLRPSLTVPSPGELVALLSGTDLVATIPERFAARLDRERIATRTPPFEAGIDLYAYTTPWARTSGRIAWLLGLISDVAKEAASDAVSDVAGGAAGG